MPKLTDSQLIVLSKGAARDDGAAVTPRGMGKAGREGRIEPRCAQTHAGDSIEAGDADLA